MSKWEEERVLKGHTDWVQRVCVTSDGSKVGSVSSDNTVRIWDITEGKSGDPLIRTLPTESPRSVCVTPDGSKLISGSQDGTIRVSDIHTGKLLHSFREAREGRERISAIIDGRVMTTHPYRNWFDSGAIFSVCVSPDGLNVVSASGDGIISIWDIYGHSHRVIGEHKEVFSMCLTPDGSKVVSGSVVADIREWHVNAEDAERCLTGLIQSTYDGWIFSVCVSPDGSKIAAGYDDNTARIWDRKLGRTSRPLHILRGHTNSVTSVCISPDGSQLVTASADNTIRIWDVNTGKLLDTLEGHEGGVWSVCMTSDGSRIISGSSDKTIRIWKKTPIL